MKRFTETNKWSDPWFRKLPPKLKCLWQWLCDTACHAGTIDPDFELASFCIGEKVTASDLDKFPGRIERLENGRYIIVKFILFQYGELSQECRAHGPVFKAIEQNKIPYPYPINRVSDRDEDTHKDKDKEKDQDKNKDSAKWTKPILDEIKGEAVRIGLPEGECAHFFNYYESNGWRVGKNPMKNWRAALVNWKLNYQTRIYESNQRNNGKSAPNRNAGTFNANRDPHEFDHIGRVDPAP